MESSYKNCFEVGQVCGRADGATQKVTITEIDKAGGLDWITYEWKDVNGKTVSHEKDAFSFWCRYTP